MIRNATSFLAAHFSSENPNAKLLMSPGNKIFRFGKEDQSLNLYEDRCPSGLFLS